MKGDSNPSDSNHSPPDKRSVSKAPVPRRHQHHCPVCGKLASPRCGARGHFFECAVHHNFYNPRDGCVKCRGEAKRAEQQERKENQRAMLELEEALDAGQPSASRGAKSKK